jgi:hypothetical protein
MTARNWPAPPRSGARAAPACERHAVSRQADVPMVATAIPGQTHIETSTLVRQPQLVL